MIPAEKTEADLTLFDRRLVAAGFQFESGKAGIVLDNLMV